MTVKRKQLSLFLPPMYAEHIEQIRQEFNPIQYELINSHITLCREDEIEPLAKVLENLTALRSAPLGIKLGPLLRFSEGKGLMLRERGENKDFHFFRKKILKGLTETPRNHQPHLTLMHPRNSTCTDEIFQKISRLPLPTQISFQKISLIEQEMGKKWTVLEEFNFSKG